MKLRRVTINNFKGVRASSIAPTKLTALIGPNGSGKSSTIKAIIYGLSGYLPDDAITRGTGSMAVGVEVADTGDVFYREYALDSTGMSKSKVKLNNKTTTQKALDEHLSSVTGMDSKTMRIVTSTDVLSALKAEEFGEFILGYLNEGFTFEKVLSYCGPISTAAVEKLRSYTRTGEEYLPHTGEFGIDAVEKVYYELADSKNKSAERPALKALVKTLQARASYDGPIPKRTIEQIDADLNAILKAEGAYQMYTVALENYNKTLEAVNQRKLQIDSLKQQIAENPAVCPDETKKAQLDALLSSNGDSILRQEKMLNTLKNNVTKSREMLENLGKNECLCFEGLLCTTDKTCKKTELEQQIKDNLESIECANAEIQKLNEQKAKIEQALDDYKNNQSMYKTKVLLQKQLDALLAVPVQQPVKPELVEQKDYTDTKNALEEEKKMVLMYNACKKEEVELEKKQKELEVVEELVAIFKPKGIFKENAINYYLEMLEAEMNNEAANLKAGFTVKLVYDAGVHILCEAKQGQGYIPYRSASSGEQVFVLYLILTLLNNLTGLRILIMDDLNHLDKEAFASLIQLLNSPSTQDNYDHIFVSSVNNSDVVSTLKSSGFNVINL